MKISKRVSEVLSGVMVPDLCLSSDDPLYLYKVSWKYLKGFLSYWKDSENSVKKMQVEL